MIIDPETPINLFHVCAFN